MYINQLARQQKMMYQFINRGTNSSYQNQIKSQFSSASGYSSAGKSDDTVAGMLQSMGISGLQGRTVREMAQYQMRTQKESGTTAAQQSSELDSVLQTAQAQRFTVREQYTPISDKATEAMQKLALEDAKGSATGETTSQAERAKLIQEQLKDVAPSKRSAAFNTMNKVWESETERIGKYIKEKDADWNDWGDKFDTKLLDDYKAGVNIWM
jgi:hypothetical protein